MGNIFYYGASKCMISKYNSANNTYATPWEEHTIKQLGIDAGSSNSSKFYGSNRVVMRFDQYDVELYTLGSDMGLEDRLDASLAAHGFACQRSHITPGEGVAEAVWSTWCAG